MRRYALVALPETAGAIIKSLDGTVPVITVLLPSAENGVTYTCVKVEGWVQQLTYKQTAGPYEGYEIFRYWMRYQEVGEVA